MARPLLCTPPAPPHAGGQGKGGADRSLLVRLCEGGRTLRLASIGILMRFLSWGGGTLERVRTRWTGLEPGKSFFFFPNSIHRFSKVG